MHLKQSDFLGQVPKHRIADRAGRGEQFGESQFRKSQRIYLAAEGISEGLSTQARAEYRLANLIEFTDQRGYGIEIGCELRISDGNLTSEQDQPIIGAIILRQGVASEP